MRYLRVIVRCSVKYTTNQGGAIRSYSLQPPLVYRRTVLPIKRGPPGDSTIASPTSTRKAFKTARPFYFIMPYSAHDNIYGIKRCYV